MKYHLSLRVVHWLVAFLVIAMLICGFIMTSLDAETYKIKWQLYAWHKDLGILVLALMLIRLVLRHLTIIPTAFSEFSLIERVGAYVVHQLFYVFLILEPIIGYLMSSYGGKDVYFFYIKLPLLVSYNKELARIMAETHGIVAFILVALILLHVLAALKHHYFDKKDIMHRMI